MILSQLEPFKKRFRIYYSKIIDIGKIKYSPISNVDEKSDVLIDFNKYNQMNYISNKINNKFL